MKHSIFFGILLFIFIYSETGIHRFFPVRGDIVTKKEMTKIDSLLQKYNDIYMLPRFIARDTTYIKAKELLNDNVLWRHLENSSYDALPNELRLASLEIQFNHYGYLLNPFFWENTSTIDWDETSIPVRSAAYLLMINEWADRLRLDSYTDSTDIKKWFIAMMIQESFLNHSAVNIGEKYKDIGLPQISHLERKKLVKNKEFLELIGFEEKIKLMEDPDEIFYNPYYSIAGGILIFRNKLIEAKQNLETAIMSYNVGLSAAKRKTERALKYLDYVKYRYSNYVTGHRSPTWEYVFEKAATFLNTSPEKF